MIDAIREQLGGVELADDLLAGRSLTLEEVLAEAMSLYPPPAKSLVRTVRRKRSA